MSILGLIVEYNPFHNGHLYHFNTSLDITQAEYSICVISGNFVQRGEPAIVDKWSRTSMALNAGVDLVVELPVSYCIQSAELFAYGAVSLLNSMGLVDTLCFGSESGDIHMLQSIAGIISTEPSLYKDYLKAELDNGSSFAVSRASAILQYACNKNSGIHINHERLKIILQSSNNILGFEYVKWLNRLNSPIKPVTIERMHSSYNDESTDTPYASATAIRKAIKEGKANDLDKLVPVFAANILNNEFSIGKGPIFLENYTQALLCLLRRLSNNDLSEIIDVNEGLENKIKRAAVMSGSINELIDNIKSKRYTETRIRRILINTLLGIKKSDLSQFKTHGGPQYIRVLGFSEKGKKIISMIKSSSSLPIITNVSDFRKYNNPYLKKMMELDILSSDIYAASYMNSDLKKGGYDFYNKPIMLW